MAILYTQVSRISYLALSVSVTSGPFNALAGIALYKAFIIGPIKLVAPVFGAYPVFALIFSGLNGNLPTYIHFGAVIIIVICAGYMATSKEQNQVSLSNKKTAIFWAIASSFSFASSFALGQYASNLSDQYALFLPNQNFLLLKL